MIKYFLGDVCLSYRLTHPIGWIMDLFREIRAFIQRGCRGYADCDSWSLDWYLCEWLPKALRHLAKYNTGCPEEFYDETRKDDECWRWKETLIKMVEGFEANKKILEMEWENEKEHKELDEKWRNGAELFIKYFDALWD